MQPFNFILLVWYVFPIIAIFASRFIVSFFHLKRKYQVKAPDLATVFLIIGLHFFSKAALGETLLSYYFISIILLGMILPIIHAYFFDDINYSRLFKMYWRMVFLFTLVVYCLLIVIDLASFMMQ